MLAYIRTPSHISLAINGRARMIAVDHINTTAINDLLAQHDAARLEQASEENIMGVFAAQRQLDALERKLLDLIDVSQFVAKWSEGRVAVGEKGVLLDGRIVHSAVTERIVEFLRAGVDFSPLARFLERCAANPNQEAVEDLYKWVELHKMPLTSDGRVVAYKKVNADYSSSHDNRVMNKPGTRVFMKRSDCDPSRDNTCSSGLHWCSFGYLRGFGCSAGARVVLVAVCPSDVTAIPKEYDIQKGRSCAYHVLCEIPQDECEHLFSSVLTIEDDYAYSPDEIDVEVPADAADVSYGGGPDSQEIDFLWCDHCGSADHDDDDCDTRDEYDHWGDEPDPRDHWDDEPDPRHDYNEVVEKELEGYERPSAKEADPMKEAEQKEPSVWRRIFGI